MTDKNKKDEFLIARIPKTLKEKLKAKAGVLKINMSELVRQMAEKFLK